MQAFFIVAYVCVFAINLQCYNCGSPTLYFTSVIHLYLFFPSSSSPRVLGIDPSLAIFGVVKRITDQDIEAHSNQQVHMTRHGC